MGLIMNAEELGRIIRFHRKQAGLTQLELSRLAGLGKATVFDIEKGKQTVQLKSILQMLNTLNISLTWESPLKELFSETSQADTQTKQHKGEEQ